MFNVLKDTLVGNDGKFSHRKMINFVSFNSCVVMAISEQFFGLPVNMQIFYAFLCMSGYQSGLTTFGSFVNKK